MTYQNFLGYSAATILEIPTPRISIADLALGSFERWDSSSRTHISEFQSFRKLVPIVVPPEQPRTSPCVHFIKKRRGHFSGKISEIHNLWNISTEIIQSFCRPSNTTTSTSSSMFSVPLKLLLAFCDMEERISGFFCNKIPAWGVTAWGTLLSSDSDCHLKFYTTWNVEPLEGYFKGLFILEGYFAIWPPLFFSETKINPILTPALTLTLNPTQTLTLI